MRKLGLIALAAVAFLGITSSANAATAMLEVNDFVGISFWLVSMGMIATSVFFFAERNTVAALAEPVKPNTATVASANIFNLLMKTSLVCLVFYLVYI